MRNHSSPRMRGEVPEGRMGGDQRRMATEAKEKGMKNSSKTKNVGDTERIVSAIAGGALVTWGLRRRSLGGLVVAAIGGDLLYRGFTGHCDVYQWLGTSTAESAQPEVETAITIDKPADELYRLWRDPQNLSRIMGHFADVQSVGDNRVHWRVHAPLDQQIEWDAEITEEKPGERLRWMSVGDGPLPNEGEVTFRPRTPQPGTEVHLWMRFKPPGGALGKAAVALAGSTPHSVARHALRRFKSLAETGETPTLSHAPTVHADGMGAGRNESGMQR